MESVQILQNKIFGTVPVTSGVKCCFYTFTNAIFRGPLCTAYIGEMGIEFNHII